MSTETPNSAGLRRPVLMRNREESHRAATPLELLFDLCFVVSVAVLAAKLHYKLSDGEFVSGITTYVALFIPIWWAWTSYSWFTTAFDNGDLIFRLLTLGQMAGVLAVAATIPAAFKGETGAFGVAYALMRLPLVAQWLRAARDDRSHRSFATRYAIGTSLAQALWIVGAAVNGPSRVTVWVVAVLVDMITPFLATKVAPGRVFHAAHITERYGLFTLIVLGETILAVSIGLRDVIDKGGLDSSTVIVCASALTTAFAIWWLYFDTLGSNALERHRKAAFIWGYGHALLYAAIAALGAGVAAQLDEPPSSLSRWFVALPTMIALVSLAWLQVSANLRRESALILGTCSLAIAVFGTLLPRPTDVNIATSSCVIVAVALETLRTSQRDKHQIRT
jgi:low temperature requirement protein LtrA